MIRRGVHKSVQALEAGIRTRIENWNQDPQPFTWTKTAEEILDSLARHIARISDAAHWTGFRTFLRKHSYLAFPGSTATTYRTLCYFWHQIPADT
jgi:hypothetical protein